MNDFEERLRRHAETVKERMPSLDIEPTTGERTDLKMPKKRIGLAIAAVIVALAGFTAMAATFNWDAKLLEYLNLTPEQAEKLADSVACPNVSVTRSGVTVTVRQTLSYSRGLYAVIDIEAPEGFEFGDETRFKSCALNFADEPESGSRSWDIKQLSRSGNKSTWVLCYYNSEPIKSGRLELTLDSLGYWGEAKPADADESGAEGGVIKVPFIISKEDSAAEGAYGEAESVDAEGEAFSPVQNAEIEYSIAPAPSLGTADFVTVYSGPWVLTWDFEYKNSAKVIEPDLLVHDENGNGFTVKRLELSPMSICLDLEQDFEPKQSFDIAEDGGEVVTVQLAPDAPEPAVNMKDGTRAALKNSQFGFFGYLDGRAGGTRNMLWTFEDGAIDLDNVESVTYGDQTIEIK